MVKKTVDAKDQTESGRVNKGTKVIGCHCSHPYQDEVYGNGQRVFNGMKAGWSCSVCSTFKKGE